MATTQKQMEEMIATADPALPPEKVAELAANLLKAMNIPANSSAQTCAETREQA